MIDNIAEKKKNLRKQLKARREEISDCEAVLAAKRCEKQLFELEQFLRCDFLFSYISYKKELFTHDIIKHALDRGKHIAVPKVVGDGEMQFFEIYSLSDCVPGAFGILEPQGKRSVNPSQCKAPLALLPGLAFTMDGIRLGYGGGYYDRYFARQKKAFRIGLCYDFSLLKSLPCEPHDLRADFVVAPSGVYSGD